MRVMSWLRKGVRIRLSVRALMVLVLVLGLWLGWVVHRARVQRDAVNSFNSGSIVYYDWQFVKGHLDPNARPPGPRWLRERLGDDVFQTVREIDLFGGSDEDLVQLGRLGSLKRLKISGVFTDAALTNLEGLGRLEYLELENDYLDARLRSGMTDAEQRRKGLSGACLRHLKGFSRLREVGIDVRLVTDEDLEALSNLTKLRRLSISKTDISDEGVEHLMGMRDLEQLALEGTTITDAGLARICGLPKLEEFCVFSSRIESLKAIRRLSGLKLLGVMYSPLLDDQGLAPISRLSELRWLAISGSSVTDEGLRAVGGLAELRELLLDHTQVTDRGLRHLYALKELRLLDLRGTRVSDAGVSALRERLPQLEYVSLRNGITASD